MKPDEKYMKDKDKNKNQIQNKSTNSNGDLNLVPFKGTGNPFSMSQAGWIPVYFLGNPGFNNSIASSMGLPSPMSTGMMQPNMNTNNTQGYNNPSNYSNPNNMNNYNNAQGYNTPSNMGGYNTSGNIGGYNTSGNMQNTNNSQGYNTNQGSNTNQGFNNSNLFPDDTSGENLYSYNTSNANNSNSNNSTGSSSNRNEPNILNILRDLNIDLDEDNDLVRHCSDKRIDKIYDKIIKHNPEIMEVLTTYEIPCPIAKVLIRKIIKLTLNHCKRDGD